MFFSIYRMGMAGGHNNGLTWGNFVVRTVNRNFSYAVQTGDKGVSSGLMGTDFFPFIKRKQSDADCGILCQCFADDLAILIFNLLL